MKRDMSIIRDVLLVEEGGPGGGQYPPARDRLNQIKHRPTRQAHYVLAIEGGLLRAIGVHGPALHIHSNLAGAEFAVTWQGREFLDLCRDDDVWQRAKERIAKLPGESAPFTVWKSVLYDVVWNRLDSGEHVGILG